MLRTTRYLTACFAAGSILLAGASASATTIERVLEIHFGSDPASGFVTATYEDNDTAGSVTLTLDTSGLSLSTEFVSEWYINYESSGSTAVGSLVFTYNDGSSDQEATSISLGPLDSYQADGDGRYDIVLGFDTSNDSTDRFNINEVVVYDITGTGILASDFDVFSVEEGEQGTYISAAHIQGTAIDSDWLGAVPEPGSVVLFATGLLVAGVLIRRDRRR